jgi:hypothetical protein
MRPFRSIITGLPLVLLTACVASQAESPTVGQPMVHPPGLEHPSLGRLLTQGDIQVVETHLKDFGFDPGLVDGVFTAQTQAAVRAFQARYGLPVSGRLDDVTRLELLHGLTQTEIGPE